MGNENKRYKELPNNECVVWDIVEGVENFVYHEANGQTTELYVGCNDCHAEKEFERAVKYFGGKDD